MNSGADISRHSVPEEAFKKKTEACPLPKLRIVNDIAGDRGGRDTVYHVIKFHDHVREATIEKI